MSKLENADRVSIKSRIALYKKESELKDLYVEGHQDKLFFKWFFNTFDIKGVNVYDINGINVPDEIVSHYNLTSSNKNRIIALAMKFDENANSILALVKCIADKDFDFILDKNYSCSYLLFTDYTSLDLYFFSRKSLERLFNLGICKIPCDISRLYRNISRILREIFIIRAANEGLNWCLSRLNFTKYLYLENNFINFNKIKCIESYLINNRRFDNFDEFYEVCESLRKIKLSSIKKCIRGRDLLSLLSWYIPRTCGKKRINFNDIEFVKSLIRSSADCKLLLKENLFKLLSSEFS